MKTFLKVLIWVVLIVVVIFLVLFIVARLTEFGTIPALFQYLMRQMGIGT